MNAINIPIDTIPPELKSCEQILRRAKELKNSEPVITYWCKLPIKLGTELIYRLLFCCSSSLVACE
jgi:hypothetical protein